jgi:hypothetical protein
MLASTSFYTIPLGLLSGLSLLYTTYHTPRFTIPFRWNLAATVFFWSGTPVSVLLLAPVERRIEARVLVLEAYAVLEGAGKEGVREGLFGKKQGRGGEVSAEEEESTKALLDRWGVLNLVRAVPVAGAFGCAVAAVLMR